MQFFWNLYKFIKLNCLTLHQEIKKVSKQTDRQTDNNPLIRNVFNGGTLCKGKRETECEMYLIRWDGKR